MQNDIGYICPMPSKDHITATVSDHITKRFLAKGVKLEPAMPFSDLGIDSMTVVELVMYIEEEFGIVIPADQLTGENLRSLESLVNCAFLNQQA